MKKLFAVSVCLLALIFSGCCSRPQSKELKAPVVKQQCNKEGCRIK